LHEFLPSVEEILRELENLRKFKRILQEIEDLPVIMKDLAPSLQKYIPDVMERMREIERIGEFGNSKEKNPVDELIEEKTELLRKVRLLSEVNPMLGHRGVRIGITYPEIYEMQIRAIFEATAELVKEGIKVDPEIMIPQVCTAQELKWVHRIVKKVEEEIEEKIKTKIPYRFGTMIEVVRACLRAGKLAEVAEFFSFGTNDLTQATFSFSREDAENKFLPLYNERGILQDNPFEILDIKGMGKLISIAIEWGRKSRPDLKIGICGEHGGEPRSITFCNDVGMDYVSCSPYRIPIARLVAAQAVLR
ncbi:MAG: putative PEP-binding protein, partial [Candidatus Syntropharchaeia archaeon]